MAYRYIVVGGLPFRGYTGTLTFTGLKIVDYSDSLAEIKQVVKKNYDECGGLIAVVDTDTDRIIEV